MSQIILPNEFKIEDGQPKRGGNCIVHTCIKEGKRYALKLFTKNFQSYHHEVYICKVLKRHNNVVELIDNFDLPEQKAMVLEFCPKDLKSHIQNSDVSLLDKLNLFAQIISAFKVIQNDLKRIDFQFQHRDIKPENLMIGEENQIKLIDFGESRIVNISKSKEIYEFLPSTQLCGTLGYMDPMMEYFNEGFSKKSDIWSIGATFYYILTNKVLKLDRSAMNKEIRNQKNVSSDQRKQWKIKFLQNQTDLQLNHNIENEQCRHLLNQLLQVDSNNRYGWDELFVDQYMEYLLQKIPSMEFPLFVRKQIIRLRDKLSKAHFSTSFLSRAGLNFTQILEIIIQNGLMYYKTAVKMHKQFLELKDDHQNFLIHWQDFEKCNYLLQLRSLIYFYSYNKIFSEIIPCNGKEYISEYYLENLKLIDQQPVLERIQLQFYYLFDCVKKSLTGQGLELRFINLQKMQCKDQDLREYSDILQIFNEEKTFFNFKLYDPENNLNNPNFFDKVEFYKLLENYLIKCINVFLQNLQIINKTQAKILNYMILIYQSEKQLNFGYKKIDNTDILKQYSKMQILQQTFQICPYLYEQIEGKHVFNTYFYFEISHYRQIDSINLKNIKQNLERKFPSKQCLIYENNENKIMTLKIKCQDMESQLWCEDDGDINFKKIKQQVEEIISNSE